MYTTPTKTYASTWIVDVDRWKTQADWMANAHVCNPPMANLNKNKRDRYPGLKPDWLPGRTETVLDYAERKLD